MYLRKSTKDIDTKGKLHHYHIFAYVIVFLYPPKWDWHSISYFSSPFYQPSILHSLLSHTDMSSFTQLILVFLCHPLLAFTTILIGFSTHDYHLYASHVHTILAFHSLTLQPK